MFVSLHRKNKATKTETRKAFLATRCEKICAESYIMRIFKTCTLQICYKDDDDSMDGIRNTNNVTCFI